MLISVHQIQELIISTVIQPSPLLRYALIADAVASGSTGLLLAGGAGLLSGWLGLPEAMMRYVGLFLVAYAAFVAFVGTRAMPSRMAVWTIIVLNALWVVESILLLLSGWVSPTSLGVAFVIAQALVVAALAETQFIGLRRSAAAVGVGV